MRASLLVLNAGVRTSLTFLAVAILVGCSPGRTVEQTHPAFVFVGRLEAGRSPQGSDCAWLVSASGDRLEVFYPDGWNVEFNPVRLTDPTGHLFAREGDLVRVTGPGDAIGESICSSGPPLPATSVENLAVANSPSSS